MIGDIISIARKEKKMTKAKLSEKTEINTGHLTHIEQEKRRPSHRALRAICDALSLPYQPLMHTYDKDLFDEQLEYNLQNKISYKKIPAIDKISDFIECPTKAANASLAIKIDSDEMIPTLKLDSYAFLDWNTIPNNKEVGLFKYNNLFIIRRMILRRGQIILRADNKEFPDMLVSDNDDFTIIGKILGIK